MASHLPPKANVVIVERFGYFDDLFQERLRAKGYGSQTASNASDAARIAAGLNAPLIIFEFGSSPENTKKGIEEILQADQIKEYPLLVLGKNVNEHTSELNKHVRSLTHLDSPTKSIIVLERIDKIIAGFNFQSGFREGHSESKQGSFHESTIVQTEAEIQDDIFKEIFKLKLSERKIGGDQYVKIKDDGFEGNPTLPISSKVKNLILPILENSSSHTQRRFYRINFACQQFSKALNIDDEKTLCLSTLYAKAFLSGPEEYLTREYTGQRRSGFRKELCSKIKDSALEVGFELQDKDLSSSISSIGKVIGEEESLIEKNDIHVAIVLAVDFLERCVIRRGHFSPRVAYDVVRKVKLGLLSWLPAPVAAIFVKFLSEAIAATTVKLLVTKKMKQDPKVQAVVSRIIAEPLKDGEQHISLSDLSPGMHLTRPIHGFDGKEVLAGNLTLDEDLVFRIWQLATLKPLIEPTVKA